MWVVVKTLQMVSAFALFFVWQSAYSQSCTNTCAAAKTEAETQCGPAGTNSEIKSFEDAAKQSAIRVIRSAGVRGRCAAEADHHRNIAGVNSERADHCIAKTQDCVEKCKTESNCEKALADSEGDLSQAATDENQKRLHRDQSNSADNRYSKARSNEHACTRLRTEKVKPLDDAAFANQNLQFNATLCEQSGSETELVAPGDYRFNQGGPSGLDGTPQPKTPGALIGAVGPGMGLPAADDRMPAAIFNVLNAGDAKTSDEDISQ